MPVQWNRWKVDIVFVSFFHQEVKQYFVCKDDAFAPKMLADNSIPFFFSCVVLDNYQQTFNLSMILYFQEKVFIHNWHFKWWGLILAAHAMQLYEP